MNYADKIKAKAIKWYKQKALEKLSSRVEFYQLKVGKSPRKVSVRQFSARWGTCQEDDSINFNWKLIIAPMSIIDYVVVHELCHLITDGHSKEFWSKLSAIIIDHEKRKEWLRINGATLTL